LADTAAVHRRRLAIDVADLETLILWTLEDLVAMKTVEGVGRVLTR
jgi:hypothetical protein